MLKNMPVEISSRLKMLFEMLPAGEKLGDVGTDHGLLPIYSIQNAKFKSAIASDLREGPLKIASQNIKSVCLEDKIETLLCPGLEGYIGKDCDAIVIAGMGGLTVCKILEDWLKLCGENDYFPGNICFVLQPNTHEHIVRKFLWDNMFEIEDEQAIEDGNHVYVAYKGQFTTQKQDYTEIQCYIGKIMPERKSENDIVYFNAFYNKQRNILSGLEKRTEPDDETKERTVLCKKLIAEIKGILN